MSPPSSAFLLLLFSCFCWLLPLILGTFGFPQNSTLGITLILSAHRVSTSQMVPNVISEITTSICMTLPRATSQNTCSSPNPLSPCYPTRSPHNMSTTGHHAITWLTLQTLEMPAHQLLLPEAFSDPWDPTCSQCPALSLSQYQHAFSWMLTNPYPHQTGSSVTIPRCLLCTLYLAPSTVATNRRHTHYLFAEV